MTSPSAGDQTAGAVPVAAPVRTMGRSSVDASRLVVAAIVLVAALAASVLAHETARGVAEDLTRLASNVPAVVISLLAVMSQTAFLLVVVGAPVALLVRRRMRLTLLALLASVVAAGVFAALGYLAPALGGALLGDNQVLEVPGGLRLPVGGAVAGFTAGAVVIGTELTRRWTRALWVTVGLLVATQVVTSSSTPLDLVVALALGVMVGSAVLVGFGRRLEAAGPREVSRALARADIVVTSVGALEDPTWPDWPLRVTTADGTVLAGRTIGEREQRTDMFQRRYRWLRLKEDGDEQSYSSPRQAATVQAMMSLLAASSGVRTPVLKAVQPIHDEEFLLVVEHVPGRPLADLSDDELTREVLADAWRQVAALRRAGIAHRDLQLSQLLVDGAGAVWVRDVAFGEAAASDAVLEGDVVELLAGTSARVGPQAAVAAATDVLPGAVLAGALARLVPASLTRTTRAAVKASGGLDELVAEVCRVTGVSEPVFAQVERVRPRTLVIGATLALAMYLLLPQLSDVPTMLETVRTANWRWLPAVVVASVVTYLGAAIGLTGGTPGRVPLGQALLVSLSSSSVSLVAPGAIGQVGLNVRFLRQRGYSMPVSVSASAAKETAMFVMHILLLASFAIWAAATGALNGPWAALPPIGTVLAVAGGVLGVLGLLVALPAVRRWWRVTVRPALREALSAMSSVAASPAKMTALFGGVALVPLGYAVCLYCSLQAFGGGASFVVVALLYLSVGALASAAPTPGGLGAVEAVLLAALTGVGVAPAVALATVVLYRLATFWLPLPPSFAAFRWLTRREVI